MFEGLDEQIKASDQHSRSLFYWSIPYYWLRERRLAKMSRSWVPATATVESAQRTKGGYGQTVRAELWYSYSFEGTCYRGHVIRDTCWRFSSANNLVDDYASGQTIEILINPQKPGQSYFPSGFGWIEPFFTLFLSGLASLLVAFIVIFVGIIPALQRWGFIR